MNKTRTRKLFISLLVAANLLVAGVLTQGVMAQEEDGRCDDGKCFCTGPVCAHNGATFTECTVSTQCE